MGTKYVDKQTVCVYTLEPLRECIIKHASVEKICPFTFEPCYQLNPSGFNKIKLKPFESVMRTLKDMKNALLLLSTFLPIIEEFAPIL